MRDAARRRLAPVTSLNRRQADLVELDEQIHDHCGAGFISAAEEDELGRAVYAAAAELRAQRPRQPVRGVTLAQVEEAERLLTVWNVADVVAMTRLDEKTVRKIRDRGHVLQNRRDQLRRCPTCGARLAGACLHCRPGTIPPPAGE